MLQVVKRAFFHVFTDLGLVVTAFSVLEVFRARIQQLSSLQSRLLVASLFVCFAVVAAELVNPGRALWLDWASHLVGIAGGWIVARWLIKKEWTT